MKKETEANDSLRVHYAHWLSQRETERKGEREDDLIKRDDKNYRSESICISASRKREKPSFISLLSRARVPLRVAHRQSLLSFV